MSASIELSKEANIISTFPSSFDGFASPVGFVQNQAYLIVPCVYSQKNPALSSVTIFQNPDSVQTKTLCKQLGLGIIMTITKLPIDYLNFSFFGLVIQGFHTRCVCTSWNCITPLLDLMFVFKDALDYKGTVG